MIIGKSEKGNVNVDLTRLISTRLLIQANSGGGKSWLLRRLLEQSYGQVQQIVIDLEGEFSTLREKFDYLLVGKEGEIPANIKTAELLAIKLLKLNVSTIIDLSELKHPERITFVKRFLDSLISAPRELWHACLIIVDEAHQFCLSADTEILTNEGWKKYNEIHTGDLAFSFNKEERIYELKPIKRIITRTHTGEINKFYNEDSIDCLVTDDHRVLCSVRTSKNKNHKWSGLKFLEASKVPTGIKIPITSKYLNPFTCNIDNELLKIIGWIITDGNKHNKKYYQISQATSNKNKPNLFNEMIKVIKKRFPKSKVYIRKKRKGHKESVVFNLGIDATKIINHWMDGEAHRIPRKILISMNDLQLESLFCSLVEGDGTTQYSKNNYKGITFYAGYNDKLADDFQELCIRLGYSAIKKKVKSNNQIVVKVSFKRKYASVRKVKKEWYSGLVWDITIDNSAFICRRNGKPFITGNCPEKSKSESTNSVIDLLTRGRKRGFCGVLATQRIAKLNKDAAAECTNGFVGRTVMDIDRKRASWDLGFTSKEQELSLKKMEDGEFFGYGPAISKEDYVKIKVGGVSTTHPEPGKNILKSSKTPDNIKKLLKDVIDLPKEAEEDLKTTKDFKNKIYELKKELRMSQHSKPKPEIDLNSLNKAKQQGYKESENNFKSEISQREVIIKNLKKNMNHILNIANQETPNLKEVKNSYLPKVILKKPIAINSYIKPVTHVTSESNQVKPLFPVEGEINDIELGICAKKIYSFLYNHSERAFSRSHVGAFTGYSVKSGGFKNAIARLNSSGLIIKSGKDLQVKEMDSEIAGEYDFSKEAIMNNMGVCPKKIYQLLLDNPYEDFSREEIAEQTSYTQSGGFKNAIAKLNSLGLIIKDNSHIKLNPELLELE